MPPLDGVVELRGLRLLLVLDRECCVIVSHVDGLVVPINDSREGLHNTPVLEGLLLARLRGLEIPPPGRQVRVDIHLAARDEFELASSLLQLLSVQICMGEAVHMAMVGQAPGVHAVFDDIIDVLLWIIEPVER